MSLAQLKIEDIYPLTPLQEGLLFHSLLAPESGAYFCQQVYALTGALDVTAWEGAWQQMMERHAVLRTAFAWEGLDAPVQVVRRELTLPFGRLDWSQAAAAEHAARLEEYLAANRAKGFRLSEAPQIRLTLIRRSEQAHWFVWAFHHAVLDGWSLALILKEVSALYAAALEGRTAPLPRPRPFRDYIGWLRQKDLSAAERYWRQTLQGFTAPTPLLAGFPDAPAAEQGIVIDQQQLTLSRATTAGLQDLARRLNVTMNTLAQGAWALLLNRYSGELDVVFGVTVSGRSPELAGVSGMVGLFINVLPLRLAVDPDSPLANWLKHVQARQLGLSQHEHSPLVKVQAWSGVAPKVQLFETIFAFENFDREFFNANRVAGLELENIQSAYTTHYPITVILYPGAEFSVRIDYDTRRFGRAAIARLLGHLRTLLEGMLANPAQCVGDLPILPAEEYELVMAKSRGTPPPRPTTLHEWFEAQVARAPEAVAVTFEQQRLTYRELNERANQLAHCLRGCGVGPDVIVGLCVDRSLEMAVGILGILKAGGAYLPIDLAYPKERLAFMLEDADAPVLLTQTRLLAGLPAHQARVICLDDPAQADLAAQPVTNPAPQATADNLAYVIFTSGSTGKPKGALITHHNVVRLMQATEPWYHFDERDVWSLFHSYAFDFSVWEIWGAWLYGGRVVVVPFMVSRSPEAFYELLATERVTVLNQTPSAFRQLIQVEQSPAARRELALRYVIFGGEALEMQSLKPWFDLHGDKRPQLVNMYGITETTVHVTYRPLTQDDVQKASVIGAPIPDLYVYILDPRRQPAPLGAPGEMYVGGAGLARGYLNRAGLTAERFIRDPFGADPNARLYKTGDLARLIPGGDIEYLGRIDNQVKIRGFRIELGEIESGLCAHPAVREAVVLARADTPGEKQLVAYLTPRESTRPPVGELREHLKASLPEYMVPSAFVWLDRLPLTNNGKVDRKALPAPEIQRPDLGARFQAPASAVEQKLAAIWQQVLKLERVGIHDNFFDLGGHSLSIVRVHAQLREQLNADVSIVDLFQYPTISALAEHLSRQRYAPAVAPQVIDRAQRQKQALAQPRPVRKPLQS